MQFVAKKLCLRVLRDLRGFRLGGSGFNAAAQRTDGYGLLAIGDFLKYHQLFR